MKTNHNVHLTIAGLAILLTTSVRADDLPTPAGTNLAVDTRAWTVLQPELVSVTPFGGQIKAAPGNANAVAAHRAFW